MKKSICLVGIAIIAQSGLNIMGLTSFAGEKPKSRGGFSIERLRGLSKSQKIRYKDSLAIT